MRWRKNSVIFFSEKSGQLKKKRKEKWGHFTCEKCLGIGRQYLEENKERLLKMARERDKLKKTNKN